jgi:hypothetical protein
VSTGANITDRKHYPNIQYHRHGYVATRHNKRETIYSRINFPEIVSELTPTVRIEDFKGFSKAKDFHLYFRIKNDSHWIKSKAITGLYPTKVESVYYGNVVVDEVKTLIMFRLTEAGEYLDVFTFPFAYLPNIRTINRIAQTI